MTAFAKGAAAVMLYNPDAAPAAGPFGTDPTLKAEYVIAGGHPDYHDAGDDPSKMEADVLGWTGQFVLQGMMNVADETAVNLLIADRLNQYHSQRFAPPDISGATDRSWQFVKASTNDELLALMTQRIKDTQATAPAGRRSCSSRS
jgi:hypothetical protein